MITILRFSAGLAFLLYGMQFMKNGLEQAVQTRMRVFLQKLTKTTLLGALTGLIITLFVQSSTAISVLTIGFVQARIIGFEQAVGIILGTNVGTSVTAQIMSFHLENFALPALGMGAIMMVAAKRKGLRYLGQALAGFGVVMLGMDVMAGALEPLKDSPLFAKGLAMMGRQPFLAVLGGIIVTALIHSSSATTGIVMALSFQGLINLPAAIGVVLGSNVGTCITAVLASIGSSRAGKQVAAAHVILNIVGVAVFLPFLYPFSDLVSLTASTLARQIANAHTIFNIFSSLAVLPFVKQFARVVRFFVPD